MAFIRSVEHPCITSLIETNNLASSSFNPTDYFDFSSIVKAKTSILKKNATVETTSRKTTGFIRRVMSEQVDRVTGEVLIPPLRNYKRVHSVHFQKGDILLHKYASRIGRIGLADFEGYGVNHLLTIRPRKKEKIDRYYLLLALRCNLVLTQLPFRETARPGIRKEDIEQLVIPRLDEQLEHEIGLFISDIFYLRKKARELFYGLLNNFNNAILPIIPEEDLFLVNSELLEAKTFLPGRYRIKSLQSGYVRYTILGKEYSIIEPPYLCAGNMAQVLTTSDFRPEGIMPQNLKDSVFLKKKNFANVYDILLNRMESSKERPFKATVVLPDLEYLKIFGLSIEGEGIALKIPMYEHILILKKRKKNSISPFYLLLVLNSKLMQYLIKQIKVGSTGLIYIPQTILASFKIPLFDDRKVKMLSDAVEICLTMFSHTLRMLTYLGRNFSDLVSGTIKETELLSQIENDREELRLLTSNVSVGEKVVLDTENLTYGVKSTP